MTLDEFYALPRISSFFPLVYTDGAKWTQIYADCADCRERIDDNDLRGEVRQPIRDVFVIEAKGYCQRCRRLTRVERRLMQDRSAVFQNFRTGEWFRTEVQTTWTWRARLRRWNREMNAIARLVASR